MSLTLFFTHEGIHFLLLFTFTHHCRHNEQIAQETNFSFYPLSDTSCLDSTIPAINLANSFVLFKPLEHLIIHDAQHLIRGKRRVCTHYRY